MPLTPTSIPVLRYVGGMPYACVAMASHASLAGGDASLYLLQECTVTELSPSCAACSLPSDLDLT